MPKKLTTEEFIHKAIKVHGTWYDYSKVIYESSKMEVIIICPTHGQFSMLPNSHLNGRKCKACNKEESDRRRITKQSEKFITRATSVHGGKYDYSKTAYTNSKENVDIVCPIHGLFKQSPNAHIKGNGCPHCGALTKADKRRKSIEEFISEANEVHNYRYDYSKSEYKNSDTKIKIICPVHGEFLQLPYQHLKGCGCWNCKGDKAKETRKRNRTPYTGLYTEKFFEINEDQRNLPAFFYIISMYNAEESFIKVGITQNYTQRFRGFSRIGYDVDIIVLNPMSLYDAFLKEEQTKGYMQDSQYTPSVKFCGWTECYNRYSDVKTPLI